ncbi:MAG: multidrug transporter [Mesorhizobium sp.]|uniref:SapC family protein n=1 Tax=Mesorhizobium sp. TaxID=1871066 RepID=UPI000FE8E812|nr:SapC family protein [Mesorhizobium sp.]RWD68087.1 MAG: multidrug transporter [Mesorhizobium sp.]RWE51132.1 MAG: multidrug transporter [Mesorhizobium sp.]TIV71738.1 MAG: multidrug transporter [Mesorhizobium sp.]
MTTQLLFYQNATPVSAERHKDLAVKAGVSYRFASSVNSVPLTAVEFAQAAAEYPIVFAGADDSVMPVVVLGAQQTENLFINDEGAWQGKYIPAFVRRYPFVFSTDKSGKTFILHIDESFEGCNREGRGERLFDNDGQQTQYLKSVLNFLQDYQGRFQRTKEYCDRLKALDLLQPMQAQFNLNSGERRSLSGFMTVNREKLKVLPDADLLAMFRNDELECTYLHLHSLRHFGDMIERIATRGAAPEIAAEPIEISKEASRHPSRTAGRNAKVEEASA